MAVRVYRVAVLGCPRALITDDGSFQGVGKSCLCNRFIRPEAYTEGHDSVLSEDDWTGLPVYNGDHFIYWGASSKHLQDGTKVRFQVVEQTEFYEMGSSDRLCPHPADEDYLTRASAVHFSSRSRGKVAYRLHAEEVFARRSTSSGPIRATQLFPNNDFSATGKGKSGIYGYICVFDPTLEGEQMERQIAFVTELLRMLEKRKRKMVLACTKCDAVDDIKIRYGANLSMYALKKKQVPFIEVSARESINIEEVFFSLISSPKKHHLPKGVKRTSPSNFLTYRAVKETRKYDLNHARDAYRKLLQQKVTDFSATWGKVYPMLEREPEFSLVLQIAGKEGKEMVKKMFCLRLIEIKLTEASKQYGFSSSARKKLNKDQSRSHQDHLSKAFKEHPDLGSESLYDYIYSPGASIAGSLLEEASNDAITEPSTPSTFSSSRDTPDSGTNCSSIPFLAERKTASPRPHSLTTADLVRITNASPSSSYSASPLPRSATTHIHMGNASPTGSYQFVSTSPRPRSEFVHMGNASPTGSYHNSSLPRSSKKQKYSPNAQYSPMAKHFSFIHSPTHSEGDRPLPLPPQEAVAVGQPLSKYDTSTQSQPFLDRETESIGTAKRDQEMRRLSSSMDCLLLPEENGSISKKSSFSRLEAEPYLQPVDIQTILGTRPPPLPPFPPTPKSGRDKQPSLFRSMRWPSSSHARPPLPQMDTGNSLTVSRSKSVKTMGHRRTKSDHMILEHSDLIPPTPPPRDKDIPPPIPPRDTPKHTPSKVTTPTPSSATSGHSHASSSVKSPIESSLDFLQSKMEGFQRFVDSENPRVSRRSEEEDEDNVSVISGPFEEIGDGSKATGGPQTEVAGRNSLERTSTPSDKSSTLGSTKYVMPNITNEEDDPSSLYCRIEEYPGYMPMAPAAASIPLSDRRQTVPYVRQHGGGAEHLDRRQTVPYVRQHGGGAEHSDCRQTVPYLMQHGGGAEHEEVEAVRMKKATSYSNTQSHLQNTPTKKRAISNASVMSWGKIASMWKKQQPVDDLIIEEPSSAPYHSYMSNTLPAPHRQRPRSPNLPRPLPPSPIKPIHLSNDSLCRRGSGGGGSNIYEVIDEEFVNKVKGRKVSSALGHVSQWAPPVDPRNMTEYLQIVQMFFSVPEIHSKWVETVSSVVPDADPNDYPPPFYSPPTDSVEPDTTQTQGDRTAINTEPDMPTEERKQPSQEATADDDQIPVHLSNPAASPKLPTPHGTPLQLKRSQFPSPRIIAQDSPLMLRKAASREDFIEQMNLQLRNDSDSDTDEDDDSDTDSDSESEIDQVTDYQHESHDHAEQMETDQATTLMAKSRPDQQSDLDMALNFLVSTDSDLVDTDSIMKSPQSNGNHYLTSSGEVTEMDCSSETLSLVPRRDRRKGEFNGSARNYDSGISTSHSQTFDSDGCSQNNESEC